MGGARHTVRLYGGTMKATLIRTTLAMAASLPLMLSMPQAAAQTCPAGSVNPLAAYDNQSPSQTVINGNNVYVGNSRLQLTHNPVSATITPDAINDQHIPEDIGVRIGHSGTATNATDDYIESTYAFRSPSDLTQYLPVTGLEFNLHDIDAGDNVIVNAYDQNGVLINLTGSGIYRFETGVTPVVSYASGNRFSSIAADVGDRRGTVYFDFGTRSVSRVVLRYYDTNSGGTYTVAGLAACNPTLTLRKTTQLLGGGPFGFTLTNTSRNTGATVTTAAPDTPAQVDGDAATADVQVFSITTPNTQVTINESSLPTGWTLVPTSTTCTNAGGAPVGTLSGSTMTIPATATFAGAAITCTYTNLAPRADVQVVKTATPNPVVTGQVVTYSLVVRNNGPQAASNVVLSDLASIGQTCSIPSTSATCTASSGATCPASIPVSSLLAGGVTIPALAVNAQVTVTLQCTATASGFSP